MATFAKNIQIPRAGNRAELRIDGEAFPWEIATSGISLTVTDDDIPSITITIPVENLTVTDNLHNTDG